MKHSDIVRLDGGTREGRKSLIAMARSQLRLARADFAHGDFASALDALLHAQRVRALVTSYIAMRHEVLNPQPKPRPWWMLSREEREAWKPMRDVTISEMKATRR